MNATPPPIAPPAGSGAGRAERFALACSANTLRFADLRTRAAAASGAGFSALGLRLDDYRHGGLTDAELRALLGEHRLRILEVEHTWDWADPVPHSDEDTIFHLAAAVGYRQLNLAIFTPHELGELVAAFARICDRATEYGVVVGLEFLPYSAVRTLGEAWKVVRAAGRDNGGIIVDLWHWRRSGATLGDLDGIPAERFVSLQLCEARTQAMADPRDEARHHRELPGHGLGADGGTAALLAGFADHGISCPVSVEVFSDALDTRPAHEAAAVAAVAGAQVLAEAGWDPGNADRRARGGRR